MVVVQGRAGGTSLNKPDEQQVREQPSRLAVDLRSLWSVSELEMSHEVED